MSTRTRILGCLLAACLGWGQPSARLASTLKVNFPEDAPVALVAADWGESRETARGSALLVDVHSSLTLRNVGPRRICGITLMVVAQALTPGGKASVSVPSLNVKPGETFPIRLDLRLLRPGAGAGPLVQVELDGVLFDDLSFYGANRLNSRRLMTAWELEARRDRQHCRALLEAYGPQALQRYMLEVLAERPRLGVRVSRAPATALAGAGAHPIQFACLQIPGAPLELLRGEVLLAGAQAITPRFELINRSKRTVRYFEIAWLLRDRDGVEYLAGTVPSAEATLPPGQRGQAVQDVILRFATASGRPLSVESLTGFLAQVEFADGEIWIPDRRALEDARLRRVLPPSAEEQRLAELYRRQGLSAVIQELSRHQ